MPSNSVYIIFAVRFIMVHGCLLPLASVKKLRSERRFSNCSDQTPLKYTALTTMATVKGSMLSRIEGIIPPVASLHQLLIGAGTGGRGLAVASTVLCTAWM